ncbi:MAG: phosphoglycerate mutase (2,3-diphosphoglycerate-independent) [Candidatus Komeilibacteria bacterium CG11_big_fil_rev_8_21_14_0_20_36_20]|uniref:2,3-bisphosphoglycerate-independent phosphoglycerate mutase n=1 Tax=Candidatus Komeilibacteria bacterium CG11_big_fil_rev_8_21_14_0_20_36_20 TaxID=1974477 RepID=A0A2H0NE93_9BACT|nr:MAG: phosphoglycerate mutase (2,3-diphosphoglycerate-independent) [Candidatus Komeilibacteria bacterium CG11_big_fil_rev_8_21_14_0_20_36_20]PIR81666.1 MAG: 2,3-bisphosphoglycerate-independent phosphoglycerate mutase [Candidatus Komeilibacteria bacterium CG10_big_fil_rev_8_21_14_0_10_36_65]PJC55597.1 MAG: 2,3-bisphosphoglycerate-independent phosphoglycerate mutase [Candidatus Komeilibacteria bacterium CG_4_9_14_0_2_um_filter_36_13]
MTIKKKTTRPSPKVIQRDVADKEKVIKKGHLPLVLIILDGWGLSKIKEGNAIALAKTPIMDGLYKKYPNTQLGAFGRHVGLSADQPGNSEAGHMNIGAGRVVEQDTMVISRSISNGTFFKNPAFLQAAQHAIKNNSDIHLMGLLSDGRSPHSDNDHLIALINFFLSKTKQNIFIHLFTDGRDSAMFTALKILNRNKIIFNNQRVKIASVMGRFYAMDRRRAWSRTQKAYEAMVLGKGLAVPNAIEAINQAYNRGESDEFIPPSIIVNEKKKPVGMIACNDAVVFFNLRSDRARQLCKSFVQKNFIKDNPGAFKRTKMVDNLLFVALTDFGPDLDNIITAYPGIDVPDTLVHTLRDWRQVYIAETEKYAHMTYFFNGGYDHPVAGETRINIPSVEVDSYDKKPAMSTRAVMQQVLDYIKDDRFDFVAINFASPDMIGHTGNLEAAVKAVQIVDQAVGRIVKAVLSRQGTVLITADHGNVEEMINVETGEIITRHSSNFVPFVMVSRHHNFKLKKNGELANIAPTILDLFQINKPSSMSSQSLIDQ